jgi:hypothetical protein
MKARKFQKALVVAVASACLALLAVNGPAQDSTNTTAAPQLSYGVVEILKLAQAKVTDDTIIAYIKSSGNSYNLNAAQIIYLRQQGVSDAVITTMLNQPKPGTAAATVPMPTTPAPQPVASTAYEQPAATYVESEPTTYCNYEPCYYPVYSCDYWPCPVIVSYWGGYWHGGGWHRGGWHWHGTGVVHGGGRLLQHGGQAGWHHK